MDTTQISMSGREEFLKVLMESHGVKERHLWENNNRTVSQEAYIINVKNLKEVSGIISAIYSYNKTSHEPPIVAVPVAGWAAKDPGPISFFSETTRKERLVEEYAKSFSLSSFTTGENADVIIRISKEAQKMFVFENELGARFVRVTPGCRVTDIEEQLAKSKLAFSPNMLTLHAASWVGAASNGCYGPGKNYTSMTSNIIEMKVISPSGKRLTLSAKENPKLFSILRDCHMGAGFFVTELTIANIEPDFLLKRTDLLLKDVGEFRMAMKEKDLLNKPHFIMHFIPVGMGPKVSDHCPRFRISTFERTIEAPDETTQPQQHQDLVDWLDLTRTAAGEPLVKLVLGSKRLQRFFDVVLEFAAKKTFGSKKERVEIGGAAHTIHLLKTYTESPLTDVNWLIQVPDVETAQNLLVNLMSMAEERLTSYAKKHEYPLLTIYARFLKGLYYPQGEGGVAPTAVDYEGHSILSFELLSYPQLQKKESFQALQNEVIQFLEANQFKFKYHPGKTWPDNLASLTQLFTDSVDRQRLVNYQNAIIDLHGGKEKLSFSPFLTPQKKFFIGLCADQPDTSQISKTKKLNSTQRKQALDCIAFIAKDLGHTESHKKAVSLSKQLDSDPLKK